ncbi:MAG: hypothetical protein MK066_01775 [Crocinitomicaceae bacterium]|nr:hypothetical protein [Crocinitomicaceae bacterium]
MKQLITTAVILLFGSAFSQTTAELNIDGISSQLISKILPGDLISYYGNYGTNGMFQHKNLKAKLNNVDDYRTSTFSKSVDLKVDENGQYDLHEILTVEGGSRLDLSKDVEIIVYIETIYGNRIWSKVTRDSSTITDPIILDQYTAKEGKDYPAEKELIVEFSAKPVNQTLRDGIIDNGDDYKKRKREDFHFMLKNKGDQNWKIDVWGPFGSVSSGLGMKAILKNPEKLDLSKTIVMRAEAKTLKGKLVWSEVELEPRSVSRPIKAVNYDGIEDQNETPNITETETNSTSDETTDTPPAENKTEAENTLPKEETASSPTQPIYSGATDLTTQTLNASCNDTSAAYTTVMLNGSKVCIHNGTPSGGKGFYNGKLEMDCNFKIAGTVFPIKGGSSIKYHLTSKYLSNGYLRDDVTYTTKQGTFTFKKDSRISFHPSGVLEGILTENTTVTCQGEELNVRASQKGIPDISFDKLSRIKKISIASNVSWLALQKINLPTGSTLYFRNGKLNSVQLSETSTIKVEEKEYYIKAIKGKSSIFLTDGSVVKSFTVTGESQIVIEDQKIAIKPGSEIRLKASDIGYTIERFYVDSPITIKVYKGKKIKTVEVKAGKKIVIKEGKVVKAG